MNHLTISGQVFWGTAAEFCEASLEELKGQKVLLIMTSSTLNRLSLDKWITALKQSSTVKWIERIPSNPTHLDVYNTVSLLNGYLPDLVLAIGGGSTIDLAKSCVGLNYLSQQNRLTKEGVKQGIKTKEYLKYPVDIPIYATPTTAGTGSEVTRWATVWDAEGEAKYSIEAPHLCPKRAYIIPEFTRSMPKRLTLSTGLDALSQAVEAYWAKSSNPMVKELAKTALRLLVAYLPQTLSEPLNLANREKVCLGSLFSGLAFSNTRTTACHSISYPLTMKFGIEHGLACALSLAKVMELNLPAIEADELFAALRVASAEELQAWLEQISSDLVELRLSYFGIQAKDLPELVDMSFTLGRMDNNPVVITPEQVKKILTSIL